MDNSSVETSTTDWTDEPQSPDVGLTINAILKIIYYSVVMVLGLFGNSLILGVYWSKPNKTSTHILIMGLAGMDLTVCLMRVHNLAVFVSFLANKETPFAFQYIRVISLVNVFASAVLTGFIAMDRYDCVCRPNNRWLNSCRANLMILISYGLAIIVSCPSALHIFWMPDSNALQKASLITQLVLYIVVVVCICIFYGKVYTTVRKHVKVYTLSRHLIENDRSTAARSIDPSRNRMSFNAGSVSTLMPSTKIKPVEKCQRESLTKTSENTQSTSRKSDKGDSKVREAKLSKVAEKIQFSDKSTAPTDGNVDATSNDRSPRSRNPNQPQGNINDMSLQRKTTRMLFVTSVVFLLTWFPYWIYVALSLAKLDGADINENVLLVLWYCTLFVYINNVVNPLIYGLANRRFRKDCTDVLRKMKIW